MMNKLTKEFTLSPKRSACHSIPVGNGYQNVGVLMQEDPLLLWNLVHRVNGVSLTRDTHFKLKTIMLEIYPEVIAKHEAKKRLLKQKRDAERVRK